MNNVECQNVYKTLKDVFISMHMIFLKWLRQLKRWSTDDISSLYCWFIVATIVF